MCALREHIVSCLIALYKIDICAESPELVISHARFIREYKPTDREIEQAAALLYEEGAIFEDIEHTLNKLIRRR